MSECDQTELTAIKVRLQRRQQFLTAPHHQDMLDVDWLIGKVARQQREIDRLQRQLDAVVNELAYLKEKRE